MVNRFQPRALDWPQAVYRLADDVDDSSQRALANRNGNIQWNEAEVPHRVDELKRFVAACRKIQEDFNKEHGITPQGIKKAIRDITERVKVVAEERAKYAAAPVPVDEIARLIKELESQMKKAAKNLEFEKAALLRDRIVDLRKDEELFSPFRKKK